MAIRRARPSPKLKRADAERIARQLSAETGQQVTADDVLGKKSRAGQKGAAPKVPDAVPVAKQAKARGPALDNPGWDGSTGFEADRQLSAKDFLGGGRAVTTDGPQVKIDESEQADLKRQLAIMMAPKV